MSIETHCSALLYQGKTNLHQHFCCFLDFFFFLCRQSGNTPHTTTRSRVRTMIKVFNQTISALSVDLRFTYTLTLDFIIFSKKNQRLV